MSDETIKSAYSTRLLAPDTWDDFAALVEANNGVWGGCWCMGFHPEGLGDRSSAARNRALKQAHVQQGTVHQMLVYEGKRCVGWCQYGSPAELPTINNPKAYLRRFCMFRGWVDGSERVAPPSGYASSAASVVSGGSRVPAAICSAFRGA